MANWAGLSYKPHLYSDDFYEQGIAIDRDTTEEKFREPKIEYDVIVIDADNNPTIYSGFGFKAKEMYDEIMRIQGEKPNISLSHPDCPKVDVSQYFQNLGEKFYFDISFGNGQGGSNQPIF